MVDARADDVHVLHRDRNVVRRAGLNPFIHQEFDHVGKLLMPMLHAVTEANGRHFAIDVRRPRIHGVWVGIIQKQRVGLRDVADVFAKIENLRNIALAVHNPARANRIANALINPVFQRNIHI